ncbi:MAG: methyl-accepting chemotaxis protein [Deltaproteobacteria bacterium]|jgi:methyl-accepting chemotaxis protein|nr:methyl-accepting chemotaxis protein [Deltaproteobacteria bacterium]
MNQENSKDWHKRKKVNFGIKRDLQVWLLTRIVGVSLLTIIIACLISYLYAKNAVAGDYLRFQINVRTVGEVFLPIFLTAVLSVLVSGLALVLFLPLKIVGPLYRVEQDLLQIASGDLAKTIKVRSNDILKEHAEAVNMAMEELGGIIKDIRESSSNLETKIMEGDPNETKKALEHHKKQLDRISNKP